MLQTDFQLKLPSRVYFGRGQLTVLKDICANRKWKRVAILTDSGVRQAGLLDRLLSVLPAGVDVEVFDQVLPEPPVSCVTDAIAHFDTSRTFDGVIGLGGGSVMDVAKVVAVVMDTGREVESLFGINQVERRGLPTVMIPTTSGTGSEATGVAILTCPDAGIKIGVADPVIVPNEAIVDPSLTDTLPAGPTAAAGIDALVHAIEGFIAKCATPLGRGVALEAVAAINTHIEDVVADGSNQTARDGLALGSHLAGIAFANSSCCAVHALAMPLGAQFHIPHGVVTGGLLAATMAHNLSACESDYGKLAAAMDWKIDSPAGFVDQLDGLVNRIGIAEMLRGYNVPKSILADLAKDGVAVHRLMDPNPKPVTEVDAVTIYERSLGLI